MDLCSPSVCFEDRIEDSLGEHRRHSISDLLLLEADGRRVLVGVGAGGVRTLHVYECVEPVAVVEAAAPPSFSELLSRWRRRP